MGSLENLETRASVLVRSTERRGKRHPTLFMAYPNLESDEENPRVTDMPACAISLTPPRKQMDRALLLSLTDQRGSSSQSCCETSIPTPRRHR